MIHSLTVASFKGKSFAHFTAQSITVRIHFSPDSISAWGPKDQLIILKDWAYKGGWSNQDGFWLDAL